MEKKGKDIWYNVFGDTMNIGNLKVEGYAALAPMAGVADRAMRELCREYGAAFAVSELVSSKGISMGDRKSKILMSVHEKERPMAVQLFGSDPKIMADAAIRVEEENPDFIDINMGCPAPKVAGNGGGSALLKDPPLAEQIVKAVVKATHLPVTVKIRSGWDEDSINAVEMAKILEDSGADAICVHGRTREQMYRPGVSLEQIAAVKAAVKIPVIGNGDIYTAADALHMREVTGCDGWMIARGAMGNPWLFAEITAALDGTVYTPPTLCERLSLAREHMHAMMAEKGEKVGFSESKKQMAWYIHGVPGAATARGKLMLCTTAEEAEEVLAQLEERGNGERSL